MYKHWLPGLYLVLVHGPSNHSRQRGFSLIELLIALATGLTLLAGVLGVFSATVSSQGYNLGSTRLNQELRTVMDLAARDIRRAGYWGLASSAARPPGTLAPDATTGNVVLTNSDSAFEPFGASIAGLMILTPSGTARITSYVSDSVVNATVINNFTSTTAIQPNSWMISNPFMSVTNATDIAVSSDLTCIQYTYDRNGNSTVDANEKFGFRLNGSAVEMHTGGNINCADGTGSWEAITNSTITITQLTFDTANSRCINLSNASSNCTPGASDYVAPITGNVLNWLREVEITLTGQLVAHPQASRTLVETVHIRNDRLTVN